MSFNTFTAETIELTQDRATGSQGTTLAPALTILFHSDSHRIGDRIILSDIAEGGSVAISRGEPGFTAPGELWGDPLRDLSISRKPFYLEPSPDGTLLLRRGGISTLIRANGMDLGDQCCFSAEEVVHGVLLELSQRVVLLLHLLPVSCEEETDRLGLVGDSLAMMRVRGEIHHLADQDLPVLLRGETGTGKEVVAHALHQAGLRASRKLVSVNLGALVPELAVSTLFGAVRGAYTGAVKGQDGYFRSAHGGTLFLDEIGEASAEVQAMLLRVLETGELHMVGSQTPRQVDVRLIAATDANLECRVDDGSFKAPLFHRLAGYEIHIPPLRERRDDLGRLFIYFVRQELEKISETRRLDVIGHKIPPWISSGLIVRLAQYHWPGNVRQLRNVVRQIVIASRGKKQLEASPKVEELLAARPPQTTTEPLPPLPCPPLVSARRKPSTVTEEELVAAIQENQWNLMAAADGLHVSRTSLYALIKKSKLVRTAADINPREIADCLRRHEGDANTVAAELGVSRRALKRRLLNPDVAPLIEDIERIS